MVKLERGCFHYSESSRPNHVRRHRNGISVEEKFIINRTGNGNQAENIKSDLSERGTVPVTPQMIRLAVKELHTKKVFVSSSLIAHHLRRYYPIENDPKILKKELNEKLDDAVFVGLIDKCGVDAYCLPTFRQEAYTSNKTDFTRFWERYHMRGSQNRTVNCLKNPRKKLIKRLQHGMRNVSDNDKKNEDLDIV